MKRGELDGGGAAMNEYEILLMWDEEAQVWIAENYEIPVVLESESLEKLMERVKITAPEILELNGKNYKDVYLNFIVPRVKAVA